MTRERFNELMRRLDMLLTPEEEAEGWHFCNEFDGLLVKGDPKEKFCGQHCVDAECGTSKEPVELDEDIDL